MNIQFLGLISSFILSIIVGVIALPILKKFKISQYIRDEGPQEHKKKSGTPTMGGIFILITISIILFVFGFFYNNLWYVLISIIAFSVVGFIDDFKKLVLKNNKGISAKMKMGGLLVASGIFIFIAIKVIGIGTDILVPIWNQPITLPILAFIPFCIFMLLSMTNALNLTDGLDGLAAGITVIIMTFFTVYAIRVNCTEVVILGSVVTGACLGFLLFNINPAKVFMGDTGSLALGSIIAISAILLQIPFHMCIIVLVCIVETVSVILQVSYFKMTKGKRLFKMAPFHHHLELSGLKEKNIVLMFWGITALMCIIAYLI